MTRAARSSAAFEGLDLLASAVVVLDAGARVVHLNQAAEQLFDVSAAVLVGNPFAALFANGAIVERLVAEGNASAFAQKRQELALERHGHPPLVVSTTAVVLDATIGAMLIEFREIDQRLRFEREAAIADSASANRELVRNLAHEIRNPLGGIRGAAQLLEAELGAGELIDYTRVIVREADRLQSLVDRLLEPHRHARVDADVNIHEVCERVRSIVLAEHPRGLVIDRDYDASLPELLADKAQLIQVVLNLVRNAAQALEGRGRILLRTRVARQVTIARRRHRLALELHVIDEGPGVAPEIRERIFFPLVSGREGGTGLGLSLAQSFVHQHEGSIDCDSRPGRTDFRIMLPLARDHAGGRDNRRPES